MSVDVAYVVHVESGDPEGLLHRPRRALSTGSRGRDVERVRGRTEASDLRHDVRASGLRVLQFLEHNDARALTENEPVTLRVEGPRCALGIVVPRRDGLHVGEPTQSHLADRGLSSARDHDVGVSHTNRLKRDTDGVRSRRTGRDRSEIGTLESQRYRHRARRHVRYHHRDEERAYSARPLLHENGVLRLERLNPTYPRTDEHARAVRVVPAVLEPCVLPGHQ